MGEETVVDTGKAIVVKSAPVGEETVVDMGKPIVVKSATMGDVEKAIREEIRSYRAASIDLLKWGVTLLISLETAIFFVRERVAKDMELSGRLGKGEQLPGDHWIIGTVAMLIVASCCFVISWLVGKQYRHNYAALKKLPDLVGPVFPPTRGGRYVLLFIYFVFPLFDGFIYFWRAWTEGHFSAPA